MYRDKLINIEDNNPNDYEWYLQSGINAIKMRRKKNILSHLIIYYKLPKTICQ